MTDAQEPPDPRPAPDEHVEDQDEVILLEDLAPHGTVKGGGRKTTFGAEIVRRQKAK